MPKKEIANSALSDYMHMIGSCRWVSRRTFDLIPLHQNWRSAVLKKMHDSGYVSCKHMRRGKRFKLLDKGYEWLCENNPERFSNKSLCMVDDAEYAEEKVRRISLLGESYMMAELAGYCAHNDDKPNITSISHIFTETAARPALTANTEHDNTSGKLEPTNGINNLYYRTYYDNEDRQEMGTKHLDTLVYRTRTTPIGSYYTMRELRKLSEDEVKMNGGEIGDLDAVTRYSKASGLLFTGGGGYRVFNAEDTAIRIRPRGEIAMKALMETWCEHVYMRSKRDSKEDYARNNLALDLRRVMKIASDITADADGVYIVCMEWQRPFFEKFIERLDFDKISKITIDYAPSKLLFSCARIMQEKYKYEGAF